PGGPSPAAWCPLSLFPYRRGRTGVFPHSMDRAKPGSISVTRAGRRFVNEANGYWDYVTGLNAATAEGEVAEAWQIGDSRAVARYPFRSEERRVGKEWTTSVSQWCCG